MAATPDHDWTVVTPTAAVPTGTPPPTCTTTRRRNSRRPPPTTSGDLTIEGQARIGRIERTSREAEKGDDNGYAISALYRASDWLNFRGTYDDAKRTAEGETLYTGSRPTRPNGPPSARPSTSSSRCPRESTFSFAYMLRDVKYPNRPNGSR